VARAIPPGQPFGGPNAPNVRVRMAREMGADLAAAGVEVTWNEADPTYLLEAARRDW